MLRIVADPPFTNKSPSDEEISAVLRDAYARMGARAGIAERAMYQEDWIGTEA